MRRTIAQRLFLSVLAALLPAPANDTAATLGAGGLVPVKSSSIVMESEELQISVHEITVQYRFRNTAARDIDAIVAFPLPELNGGDVANIPIAIPSRDTLNFVDFEVVAGGRQVTPAVEVRAFFERSEITSRLRSLGLPLSVLDGSMTAAVARLAAPDRAKLQHDGWIDCALTSDGRCWPYWRSRVQFYWTQHFPAGAAVEIRHRYRPIVGGSGIYPNGDAASSIRPYCGGPGALDAIRKLQRSLHGDGSDDRPVLAERRIDYILRTANNWAGPIRDFRLSVIAGAAEDIVLTCMPGLTQVSPTRYELARHDFRPASDLHVLLLQRPER